MKLNKFGSDSGDIDVKPDAPTAEPELHEITLKQDIENNGILHKAGSKVKLDSITIRFLKDNNLA